MRMIAVLLCATLSAAGFMAGCASRQADVRGGVGDREPGNAGGDEKNADEGSQRPGGGPGMDAFGWVYLGRTAELQGDLSYAMSAYARAAELDPGSALAAVSLARVLFRSGDPVAAAGALSRVQDLGDPWVGVAMIDLLDSAGLANRAEEAAKRTLGLAPIPRECAEWLSRRALKRGNVPAAAEALSKAEPVEGRPGSSRADAGFLLLDHGMAAAARDAFRDSVALEPLGRGRLGLAIALDSMRDWRAAAEEAQAYCSANRDDIRGAVTAAAIMTRSGGIVHALRCLTEACALPGAGPAQFAALGRTLRTMGRPKEGAQALFKARALAPSDRRIAFEYATALAESGALEEAFAALKPLASSEHVEPHVSAYHAYLLAFGGRNLDEAASRAALAVEADSSQGFYHAVLGFVMHRSGNREKAEEAFARALACDPDPMALKLHGEFLFEIGKNEEAAGQWRKAFALDQRLKDTLGKELERRGFK